MVLVKIFIAERVCTIKKMKVERVFVCIDHALFSCDKFFVHIDTTDQQIFDKIREGLCIEFNRQQIKYKIVSMIMGSQSIHAKDPNMQLGSWHLEK